MSRPRVYQMIGAVKAARVREYLSQSATGGGLLDSVAILEEISRCKQEDWGWFHELAVNKELSKNDCIEISKRIRAIDKAASEHTASIFNLTEQKQRFVLETVRLFFGRNSRNCLKNWIK